MADLTGGKLVPWFAAIHQIGEDAHNPHVHIAIHDRDIETGRRVLRLSDSARDRRKAGLPGPQAVVWIRERWEAVCNEALARAGIDARIDRRTLEAQGIRRKAGIHEGPHAQHIEGNIRRPRSRRRINGCGRVIDYPSIDNGRTRREFNVHIIDLNLERAARSRNPETAVWAQFEKDERAKDRALEEQLAREEQERTSARRAASQAFLARVKKLRAERDQRLTAAVSDVSARFVPQREAMRADQRRARGFEGQTEPAAQPAYTACRHHRHHTPPAGGRAQIAVRRAAAGAQSADRPIPRGAGRRREGCEGALFYLDRKRTRTATRRDGADERS